MSLSKQATMAVATAIGASVAAAAPAAAQSAPAIPAAAPLAAMPASAAVTPPSSYRINPGDEVEIYVWGEERLQRQVKILPDGTFAFPLVGQILAQGRLPQELEATISERLRDQYRGQVPQVTVSVKSTAGMTFSVMGKVRAPGTFTPIRYVTILDALSLAGGPAEFANLDQVIVLRKRGDTLSTIRFRLSSVFKAGSDVDRANLQRIEPGDTIIVP